jgi:hypothetical protein
MIFSQNGFLGEPLIFLFFWILKPQGNCKTNVPFVFKLKAKFAAFHALGIMDGAILAPLKHTYLFHFIGFKGGMVHFMRPYPFRTWALL